MEDQATFKYVNLNEIDPSFTNIEPGFYNLRISKAEMREYVSKKETAKLAIGQTGYYVNFALTVVGHEKFSGRKLFESLFENDFTFKCLRRIADATGVPQSGSLEDWLKELQTISPVVKLKVDVVSDVNRDGTANPKTVKPDGTPGEKNVISWKSGVQEGDVQ